MNNPNGGGIPALPEPVLDVGGSIPLDPEVEELWSSRALLLVLLLLILSFWVSYYLKVRRIRSVHETIVALFAGQSSRTHTPPHARLRSLRRAARLSARKC